jgi:hypothetical protein
MKAKLLLFVLVFSPFLLRAQINYGIVGNTAYVAASPGATGDIVIADTYQSYPVTAINSSAFTYANTLTSVTIPASVVSIGSGAFDPCDALTNITAAAGNPDYSSTNGILFNQDLTTLLQFPDGIGGSYTIPTNVTAIGDSAFSDAYKLGTITVPASVTNIGNLAFTNCEALMTLNFLGNAPTLGSNAFLKVPTNALVFVYAGTTGWSNTYGGLTVAQTAPPGSQVNYNLSTNFAYVTSSYYATGNVVIAQYYEGYPVTLIGGGSFFGNSSLASVVIPEGVTAINPSAFIFCPSLTNVVIPASVTDISYVSFSECPSLNFTIDPANPDYTSANGAIFTQNGTTLYIYANSAATNITIPPTVTSIGTQVFNSFLSLTNITIPASVTNIGSAAFGFCTNLTNFTFLGNAPTLASTNVFSQHSAKAIAYYYSGATGWSNTFGGLPTVELTAQFVPPQIGGGTGVGNNGGIGIQSGNFSFNINAASNQTVVIEASSNLVTWLPVWTNTLSGTNATFSDPQWTNYPARYYRAR